MKVIQISYPTPLSQSIDIENDNIDVFVELEDGMTYTLVVATIKNLEQYMERKKLAYLPPRPPDIIVRKLDEDSIRAAMESYAEGNAFWLKLYFILGADRDAIDLNSIDSSIKKIKDFNDSL